MTNKNYEKMRIIIASGGSGGHIFPAISVASELRKRALNIEVLMVTGQKDIERNILKKRDFKSVAISMKPFPRKFNLNIIVFALRFVQSFFESFFIILRFKPTVVVGFGGYITCPVVLAAFCLRIPSLIHEQNLKFGLANRFLRNFTTVVAVSFLRTAEKVDPRKILVSGNPVRDDLAKIEKEEALKKFNFIRNKFTILVMGGTAGSHSINESFIKALQDVGPILRSKIQIVHLTGLNDADYLRSVYQNLKIQSGVFSYLDNMSYAYSVSDLVISRAGASSINEIINFGLPSILIPYPYAGAHQIDNAKEFSSKGACIVHEENNELSERIACNLREFLNDKERLENISLKARIFMRNNAAKKIADEVILLGERKK